MRFLLMVAGTLGVSQAVATSIVNYILTADTIVTIILFVTALISGGVDAILVIGWRAFVQTVKMKVKKEGKRAAVLW